jgi:hypothetical protein
VVRQTLKYPLTIEKGTLVLSSEADIERDQIFSVLEVRLGERVYHPLTAGTPEYVFEPVGSVQSVASRIEAALTDQIPNLYFVQCSSSIRDDGILQVQINYQSKSDPNLNTIALRINR